MSSYQFAEHADQRGWLWDGESWEQVVTAGPPRWHVEFLLPDPVSGNMMAYIDNNLWEWKPREEARVDTDQSEVTLVAGRNATFGVRASGTLPLAFRWTKDGAALSDQDRVHGTATSSIYFSPARLEDAGVYITTATNSCGDAPSDPIVVRMPLVATRSL